MRLAIQQWLGREYVALSAEATGGGNGEEQGRALFSQFDQALKGQGLSLENTVRSRLICRDAKSRTDASNARSAALGGVKRAAGSSYIWPGRFDTQALVSLDLWAARPSTAKATRIHKEYDPPINPLRYLVYDGVVYLSGVTSTDGPLEKQLNDILLRIAESLKMAGSGWDKVARLSFFLHRSQKPADLRRIVAGLVPVRVEDNEITFVDGYSAEGKLIEIETTARV
jgi:enamine deaminase RidA (YjgF/YER057c/UK114 family)